VMSPPGVRMLSSAHMIAAGSEDVEFSTHEGDQATYEGDQATQGDQATHEDDQATQVRSHSSFDRLFFKQ
jgi:hypothetical protein